MSNQPQTEAAKDSPSPLDKALLVFGITFCLEMLFRLVQRSFSWEYMISLLAVKDITLSALISLVLAIGFFKFNNNKDRKRSGDT
jgi:hypothetical protein